jgi:hypothetical protein
MRTGVGGGDIHREPAETAASKAQVGLLAYAFNYA